MQAKEGVLDVLNRALANEMVAINQYFLNAEMCRAWGYERLHKKLRELSLDEMKDTERLVAHIIYLEGVPIMKLGDLQIGRSVLDYLNRGLDLERNAVSTLVDGIGHCTRVGDYTTRGILEEMVRDEETHVDWFETQLETISQVGLEHYLSRQIG